MADARLDLIVNANRAVSGAAKYRRAMNSIAKAAMDAEKAVARLESKTIKLNVNLTQLNKIQESVRKAEMSVRRLSNLRAAPKVNTTALNNIAKQAAAAEKSVARLGAKQVNVRVNLGQLSKVEESVRKAEASVRRLSSLRIAPQVNTRALDNIVRQATAAEKAVAQLGTKQVSVRVDLSQLTKLQESARKAEASVRRLSTLRITPKVNTRAFNSIATGATAAEKAIMRLEGKTIKFNVDTTSLTKAQSEIRKVETAVKRLSNIRIQPKVSTAGFEKISRQATAAKRAIDSISRKQVAPRTSVAGLNKLAVAAATVDSRLAAINARSVAPQVNSTQVGSISKALKSAEDATNKLAAAAQKLGSAFTSGATQASRSIGKITAAAGRARAAIIALGVSNTAITGLNTSFLGIGTSAAAAATGLGVLSRRSANARRGLRGFRSPLRSVSSLLGGVARGLGLVSGGLLATSIAVADASIQIENRLKLVTNSTSELVQVQGALFAQSRDARVALTAQAELYQRIGLSAEELGAKTSDVLNATEAVAKAITLSASSTQAANATIIQFGQALAFGKLRGDELRSVLEQSPRLAQALADGLGIARGELIKFGFEGNLTSKRVFAALLSQVPELRREFELLTPRIGESATVLLNSFIRVSGAMNDVTGANEAVSQSILDFADLVDDNMPAIIDLFLRTRRIWEELRIESAIPFVGAINALTGLWKAAELTGNKLLEAAAKIGSATANMLRDMGLEEVPDFVNLTLERIAEIPGAFGEVLGMIPTLGGGGRDLPFSEEFDRLDELQIKLNELTSRREKLKIALDERDALAKAGRLQKTLNGFPNLVAIDVIAKAEEAEKLFPELQRQIDKLQAERLVLDVVGNFEERQKELSNLANEIGKLRDPSSDIGKQLTKEFDTLAAAVNKVRRANKQLVAETPAQERELARRRDASKALAKARPIVPLPGDTGSALADGDLARLVEGGEAARKAFDRAQEKVGDFINSQRELIVELSTVEGIERDIAMLRFEAGDEAVDGVEALIRANAELIEQLEKTNELKDQGDKALESIQKEIDKVNALTKAEQFRRDLAKTEVRTEAEQARFEQLSAELLVLDKLTLSTEELIRLEKIRLELAQLGTKISPADSAFFQKQAAEIKAKEKVLEIQNAITDATEDGIKLANTVISRDELGKTGDAERIREQLTREREALEKAQQTLLGVSLEDRTPDQTESLDKISESLNKIDDEIANTRKLVFDFSFDARAAAQEAASGMQQAFSNTFFKAMQGDFDNLGENLVQTFANIIDRMVADALAARLAESLFSGFGGIGGSLLGSLAGFEANRGGGFVKPDRLSEVNEFGQETLMFKTQRYLIPMPGEGTQLKNITNRQFGGPVLAGETVEVAERGEEMLRTGSGLLSLPIAQEPTAQPTLGVLGEQKNQSDPAVFHVGDRTFLKMGSSGGFVVTAERTRQELQKETERSARASEQFKLSQLDRYSNLNKPEYGTDYFQINKDFVFGGKLFETQQTVMLRELRQEQQDKIAADREKREQQQKAPPFDLTAPTGPFDLTAQSNDPEDNKNITVTRTISFDNSRLMGLGEVANEFTSRAFRKGGFAQQGSFAEVNESGQETLSVGGKRMLIPDSMNDISRTPLPEIAVRGLQGGGFAKANELIEVNENGQEMINIGGVRTVINDTVVKGDPIFSDAGNKQLSPTTFMKSGTGQGSSASTFGASNDVMPRTSGRTSQANVSAAARLPTIDASSLMATVMMPGERPQPVTGREFGGAVQSRGIFEVNEGVMPELLSIGSRDFLLQGGASGYVTPLENAGEIGNTQTINMTIVSPDVDGFRKTQSQIQNELGRAASMANRRNG